MRGLLRGTWARASPPTRRPAASTTTGCRSSPSRRAASAITFGRRSSASRAVLDNLSAFLDQQRPAAGHRARRGRCILALWIFLAGGIIDRYARDRSHTRCTDSSRRRVCSSSASCGSASWRGSPTGCCSVSCIPGSSTRSIRELTHDITVERTAFAIRLGLYMLFAVVLAACNLVFDYAKVRAVVEDRRSMLGATHRRGPVHAAERGAPRSRLYLVERRAVRRRAGRVRGRSHPVPAAPAGRCGWRSRSDRLYVLARLWVKLVFWASETALFQGRLAHAGYVAAPAEWPDSPRLRPSSESRQSAAWMRRTTRDTKLVFDSPAVSAQLTFSALAMP